MVGIFITTQNLHYIWLIDTVVYRTEVRFGSIKDNVNAFFMSEWLGQYLSIYAWIRNYPGNPVIGYLPKRVRHGSDYKIEYFKGNYNIIDTGFNVYLDWVYFG